MPFGSAETIRGPEEFFGNCETASTRTTTTIPTKMLVPIPARRSGLSSGFTAVTARHVAPCVSPKPYKSSASRIARADLTVYFLRWSLEQKCESLSLRRGPIFFRQYKQPVGLGVTMTQCNNRTASMKCTKAKNTSEMGVRAYGSSETTLDGVRVRPNRVNRTHRITRMLD